MDKTYESEKIELMIEQMFIQSGQEVPISCLHEIMRNPIGHNKYNEDIPMMSCEAVIKFVKKGNKRHYAQYVKRTDQGFPNKKQTG